MPLIPSLARIGCGNSCSDSGRSATQSLPRRTISLHQDSPAKLQPAIVTSSVWFNAMRFGRVDDSTFQLWSPGLGVSQCECLTGTLLGDNQCYTAQLDLMTAALGGYYQIFSEFVWSCSVLSGTLFRCLHGKLLQLKWLFPETLPSISNITSLHLTA